jgi:hypothetical protein
MGELLFMCANIATYIIWLVPVTDHIGSKGANVPCSHIRCSLISTPVITRKELHKLILRPNTYIIYILYTLYSRFQSPHSLWRGSVAARLLGLWVRISPGACMYVCCECCVLSGRILCVGLITLPEESYQVWFV